MQLLIILSKIKRLFCNVIISDLDGENEDMSVEGILLGHDDDSTQLKTDKRTIYNLTETELAGVI